MKRSFLKNLTLYFLPLLLLMGIRLWPTIQLGLSVGELIPVQMVIHQQYTSQTEQFMYETSASRENLFDYKLRSVITRKPSVLVLGSSRMGRFREQLFENGREVFFNGYLPWQTNYEQIQFLQILEKQDALPEVLILELNLPNFNADYEPPIDRLHLHEPSLGSEFSRLRESFIRIERDPYVAAIDVPDNWHYWGLQAINNESGFINDGSVYYRDIPFQWFDNQSEAFETQTSMYTTGQELNEENLQFLEDILALSQAHGIHVFGVLPPYRQEFYQSMLDSPEYSYIEKALPRLENLFSEYDFPLLDASDARNVGGADEEIFDTWHPQELLSLRIYVALLSEYPDVLSPYSDLDRLTSIIENADNPLQVFYKEP